jgi:hypothetical protein
VCGLDKVYGRTYTFSVTYVQQIEPRLTPHREAAPDSTADALKEWCRDLEQELAARLAAMDARTLSWQPHPDANAPAVTAWHVARWLDVLATRLFTGGRWSDELWHTMGWARTEQYDPTGVGYLGLGTLTGYTPAEMRGVPVMSSVDLGRYLSQATGALVERIASLGPALTTEIDGIGLSPYQIISGTLQGSFGHLGEIDTLVTLRALTAGAPAPGGDDGAGRG